MANYRKDDTLYVFKKIECGENVKDLYADGFDGIIVVGEEEVKRCAGSFAGLIFAKQGACVNCCKALLEAGADKLLSGDMDAELIKKYGEGIIANTDEIALIDSDAWEFKKIKAQEGKKMRMPASVDMSQIKFDERGLVPAVALDIATGKVLMLAYMNRESIELTLKTGFATYFSRSRQSLWLKGETSGHVQRVYRITADCDGDTLLVHVKQSGAACHSGTFTCFENTLYDSRFPVSGASVLDDVFATITDRYEHPKEGSYTNYLFDKGVDKILKKVGEESAETIIAAKNAVYDEMTLEIGDLFYHLMVLIKERGLDMQDIYTDLERRR